MKTDHDRIEEIHGYSRQLTELARQLVYFSRIKAKTLQAIQTLHRDKFDKEELHEQILDLDYSIDRIGAEVETFGRYIDELKKESDEAQINHHNKVRQDAERAINSAIKGRNKIEHTRKMQLYFAMFIVLGLALFGVLG